MLFVIDFTTTIP